MAYRAIPRCAATKQCVMQPVVLDITRLVGRYFSQRHPTGVDRVSLAYLQHYASVARVMLRWRGLSGLFSPHMSRQVIAALLRWSWVDQKHLRWLIARGILSSIGTGNAKAAVLLHTGHNDAESASLWRSIRWHRLRPAFFVHDLIPLTHPQHCRDGEPKRHRERLMRMLRSDALLVNSRHTLTQLAHFAQEHGIQLPSHRVAHLAAPHQYVAQLAAQLPSGSSEKSYGTVSKPYFLVVGTIEPRKNHALLLRVWLQLLQTQHADVVPDLVVIGQEGWNTTDVEEQLVDTAQFQSTVRWIRQCDDASLATWMAGARACLFPSFAEGFGMPLIEALLSGTPVIASDLAVFRESAGLVPDYVCPYNVQAWAQKVLSYSSDGNAERLAQLARMKCWQAPTWDAHFLQVDALLASLAD
jgi:glycosyltransferase involved in cell wall biosynthesis